MVGGCVVGKTLARPRSSPLNKLLLQLSQLRANKEIADQTNLLALNAAARCCAGCGFNT